MHVIGPMFLGFCYCLGAAVDILMEEGHRYKVMRDKAGKDLEARSKVGSGSETENLLGKHH